MMISAQYKRQVVWDESTSGERQPRVSLWEIEPLTTVPMYPSFFPLRLKRPLQPGLLFPRVFDNSGDENAALMRFTADANERGFPLVNFQSSMIPWIQQRFEPTMVANEYDQQCMPASALSDIRGDLLKQQLLNYQQPFQLQLPPRKHTSLLKQQIAQQTQTQHFFSPQLNDFSGNRNDILERLHGEQKKEQVQPPQTCVQAFQIPAENLHHRQSPLHFQLQQNLGLPDSCTNFLTALSPSCLQSMMNSSFPEDSSNVMNFSRLKEPIAERSHQPWEHKDAVYYGIHSANSVFPPFPDRNGALETENCTASSHNSTLFGVAINSHNLFSVAAANLSTSSFESDIPAEPYSASCIQNSLYGLPDYSSGLLQNSGEFDPPTKTFVKVYKSGSVGRSLDISRFSSYTELREELGQMFGIEGQLEDPFRSGWQLLFVDRENDILLLGDGPWEAFVNSVWCIKILSPEDVQRMG